MKRKQFWVGLLLCSIFSCNIKESREGSPCTLYENSGDMSPFTVSLWRGGLLLDEASSQTPVTFEFTLGRGDVLVTASSGTANTSYRDGILSLKTEAPVDSVYAYSDTVDCNLEWTRDTVVSHKQFATVTISLNISPRHERFPDSLRVLSAWNGLDVRTMQALRGSYGHTAVCTGIKQSFRVMRQGDDSLVLRLISRTAGIVDDVKLGEMLRKAGYSWKAADLNDIEIEIHEASANTLIVILDWADGEPIIAEI